MPVAAGLLLAGCSGSPPGEADPVVVHSSRPSAPPSTSLPPASPTTLETTLAPSAAGPVAAWLSSERAFYRAGQLGEPDYPPLLASFATSSPALRGVVSFLSALQAAGVAAPSHYRLRATRLLDETPQSARLTGCSYDSGAVYRSSGRAAPASLGGGAGLTSYRVKLLWTGGRWLVWSAIPAAVSSSALPGPCHGF